MLPHAWLLVNLGHDPGPFRPASALEIDTDLTWECSTRDESDRLVARTPMRRRGQPEDVANAVLSLAREESDFVNGAMLLVDGVLIAGI